MRRIVSGFFGQAGHLKKMVRSDTFNKDLGSRDRTIFVAKTKVR